MTMQQNLKCNLRADSCLWRNHVSHFVKTSSNYVRIWPPGIHVTLKTYFCTDWQGSRSSGPLQSSFPITTMQATRTALILSIYVFQLLVSLAFPFLTLLKFSSSQLYFWTKHFTCFFYFFDKIEHIELFFTLSLLCYLDTPSGVLHPSLASPSEKDMDL